jgi:hypothetical protein
VCAAPRVAARATGSSHALGDGSEQREGIAVRTSLRGITDVTETDMVRPHPALR